MNIANKITLFRILLVPFFVLFMYLDGENTDIIAGCIFIFASITDAVDGYLARSKNLITTFGKFTDPLADKILTSAAFLVLIEKGLLPAWGVIIIIAREFIITGFRTLAATKKVTIAASPLGKLKTTSQFLSLICLLFSMWIPVKIGLIIFYIAVLLTFISGVDYLYKNRGILDLENL